jgi:hypothetical protein
VGHVPHVLPLLDEALLVDVLDDPVDDELVLPLVPPVPVLAPAPLDELLAAPLPEVAPLPLVVTELKVELVDAPLPHAASSTERKTSRFTGWT